MNEAAEAVMALYRERINNHRFGDLVPLIAPDAVFWFGDGSHIGLEAIRIAFETTWARLADETYWLDDVRWLAAGAGAAACCYRFHWQASINGTRTEGQGRGTTVLGLGPGGWQIAHEHLSAEPPLGVA